MGLWDKFKSGFGGTVESVQKVDASRFYEGSNSELKPKSHTQTVSGDSAGKSDHREIFEQARNYDLGINGCRQDHTKAFQLYFKACDKGSNEAAFFLGNLYRYGLGCKKDYGSAVNYYLQAINAGIEEAHVYLAYMYSDKCLHSGDSIDAKNAAKSLENYFGTTLFMADGKSQIVSQQPFLSKFYTCKSYYEITVDNNLNRTDAHIKPFIPQLLDDYTATYLESWNSGEMDDCGRYKRYIQLLGGKVPKEHGAHCNPEIVENYNNGVASMVGYAPGEALEYFQEVIHLAKGNHLDTYERMGVCNLDMARYDDAIEILNSALSASMDSDSNARIYAHLAFCYQMLGIREKAYKSLLKSVECNKEVINTKYEDIIDNLGWTKAIKMKSDIYLQLKSTSNYNYVRTQSAANESKPPNDDFLDSLSLTKSKNNWDEYFNTAETFYYGLGEEIQDYKESIIYYKKAEQAGSPEACLRLGLMYKKGEGCKPDYEQALDYFKEGAKRSVDRCYGEMGDLFAELDNKSNSIKCWSKYFNGNEFENGYDTRADYAIKFITNQFIYGLELTSDIGIKILSIKDEIIEKCDDFISKAEAIERDIPAESEDDSLANIIKFYNTVKDMMSN